MKTRLIVALLVLSAGFTTTSNIFAADATRPQPRPGGLLRACFSCCCKASTVDDAITGLAAAHAIISTIIATTAPDVVRELYLKCCNAAYALSDAAVGALTSHGLLDRDGNLKPEWRSIVMSLLRHDGSVATTVFHLLKSVEDLLVRAPEIVAELERQLAASSVELSPAALAKLNEYGLLASKTGATLEEIRTILQTVQRVRDAMSAASAAAGTRAGYGAGLPQFRVAPMTEIGATHRNSLFPAAPVSV